MIERQSVRKNADRMPREVSGQMSGQTMGSGGKKAPDGVPHIMPDAMEDGMSDRMPSRMSDRMPGRMSDDMPGWGSLELEYFSAMFVF